MKILLLAPQPYYIDRGTPIDVDILLRALSDEGHSVEAVVYASGEDRDYPGVTLHRVGSPRWLAGLRPGFTFRKILADLLMLRKAAGMIRRTDFDVVHAGEEAVYLAMLLKALWGTPYIYDMDSSVAQQMVERFPWLAPVGGVLGRCEGTAVRRSIAVAPVCNALRDLATEYGAAEVVTLHDISQIDPATRPAEGGLRSGLGIDGPVLMYVGNLEPYQGIDLLLAAFSQALDQDPGLSLVVAGGSERHIQSYRAKATGLGIEHAVHFIGHWPADRLEELLAEADVLVAPRIRGVNTPQKIFPYLHSGRPVLVTDLPTHTQILDSTIACLAPPEPGPFGEAMLALARDADRGRRLGARGRAFVEEGHTYPAHRKRVRELYDRVRRRLGLEAHIHPTPT